jgi:hypothetical protein
MTELLNGAHAIWLLGGITTVICHEWWRRRAAHPGESAWRARIGEELVYIWVGGFVLIYLIEVLFGEPLPIDPSDFYP